MKLIFESEIENSEDLNLNDEDERFEQRMDYWRQKAAEKYAKEIHLGDKVVINRVLSKKSMNAIRPDEREEVMALRGKTGTVTHRDWIPGNNWDRTRGGYLYCVKMDDTGEEWNFGKGDLKKIQ